MRIAFAGDSLTAGRPGSSYFAILQKALPGDDLVNLGKGNETITSLYQRLSRYRFDKPFDLTFLWIGVNDVVVEDQRSFSVVSKMTRQLPVRDLEEFQMNYQKTLELLCPHARQVIAIPPVLKGEDLDNPWNQKIQVFSQTIQTLVSGYEQVRFFDLRAIFVKKLMEQPGSSYLPTHLFSTALDILTLHRDQSIDRKAARRGLQFTLDGIHLNSVGAKIVADAFLEQISI